MAVVPLQEADKLTGLFIPAGPTVQIKQARRRASIYSDKDGRVAWEKPLAVLVNRLSASASEIFAGAIQDYGRGLIIGSQTFGKGTVQTLVPLNRGQLKITQAKFYRISGGSTQHQGVVPDIEFPELYDVDRVGESSLEDALPYDTIKPAIYRAADELLSMLGTLQAKHASRTRNNAEFQYLDALALRSVENRKRTHISLNEATRKQEKADDDAWRLNLENQLRLANGEMPAVSLDELDEIHKAKELAKTEAKKARDAKAELTGESTEEMLTDADAVAKNEEEEQEEKDALTKEAGFILLDYLQLSRQMANLDLKTDPKVARISD